MPAFPPTGSVIYSGSIDTSVIDAYRQGVELTQDFQWFLGTAKIWSGYPGHELPQTEFGQISSIVQETPFEEKSKYDPTKISLVPQSLKATVGSSPFPNAAARADGVIAPLGCSGTLSFSGRPVQGCKGDVQAGDSGADGSAAPFTPNIIYEPANNQPPFVDSSTLLVSIRTAVTGSRPAAASRLPFSDAFPANPGVAMPVSCSTQFSAARAAMQPHDLNTRLPNSGKAATSGFVYDGATYGTDSLAFGGLKY